MYGTPLISIQPDNGSDINGIIHQSNHIEVRASASSVNSDDFETYGAQNAIDPSSQNPWRSKNHQHQWIEITFPNVSIFITHYSVQSTGCTPPECGHAKQWNASGYNKGKWKIIDEVLESNINGMYAIETRAVSDVGPFSNFRLESNGQSWSESYTLRFLNIDFFGIVISSSYIMLECSSLYNNQYFANLALFTTSILLS